MENSSTLAVLIHGGHTGAWVWQLVRRLLALPSLALDLPAHGEHRQELRGLRILDCVNALLSHLPSDGRVILVGHSLGAAVALVLAGRLGDRLAHLVLIAGPVPAPGKSILSAFPLAMRLTSRLVLRLNPVEFSQSRRTAKATLLNGLPPLVAAQAAARFTNESTSLVLDPVHWNPKLATPATYVQCLRDRGPLSPSHQKRMAARLGASVVPIDACHYVILEKPTEVANVLNVVAERVR
jgi:pimeloyl-ACP methyl ester carboxylesterase